MTPQEFDFIIRDISSFADDEHDIIADNHSGEIVFDRNGQTISLKITEDEDGRKLVRYNDVYTPFKTFLAKDLARLDLLASKMLQKNQTELNFYVDPKVTLYEQGNNQEGEGLEILSLECNSPALVGSKLCFVTADAGHGKSMLLHRFQYNQAINYLAGKTNYLFWHIDLHGRDLVRLNEAIMYDLGELRMTGLYYSSILTLMRRHLIVLGIDGFDELAAEKGGEGALNSLSSLVSQMEGRGVLIAASRRAFFYSQDFVRRSGLLKKNIGGGCIFDELKLSNWHKEQCVQYLNFYTFGESDYNKLISVLKEDSHPLLERPYLFTKMVSYSYEDNISPFEFVTQGKNNLDSINDIIEAFIYREVDKWAQCNRETGNPYLSFEQHIKLLSEVALEMWHSQRDVITLDNIQLILTILFDEWKIPADIQPTIIRMVESHAMLVNVDGRDALRRFDHLEFKNFFLSRALQSMLEESVKTNEFRSIQGFLYISQLPDSVAQYLSSRIKAEYVLTIVEGLLAMRKKEWKPSYLQTNIGTLLPFILDGHHIESEILVTNKITFSSLIFENKTLENITFKDCSFVNISFKNTKLKNIKFDNCVFSGLRIWYECGNNFDNVDILDNSQISELSLNYGDEEPVKEYSPNLIFMMLPMIGINCNKQDDNIPNIGEQGKDEFYKLVKRLLNRFSKSTSLYESNIRKLPYYNFNKPDVVLNEIIPLFVKYDIIEERENKNTRQAGTTAWVLKHYDIPEIFKAEDDSRHELFAFWYEVKHHE